MSRPTPAAMIAAALAEAVRFEPAARPTADGSLAYGAEVPGGGSLTLVVPKSFDDEGRLELTRAGALAAQATFTSSWVAFGPRYQHPDQIGLQDATALVEELSDAARIAGGEPFSFGKWTRIGGEGITLDMHAQAREAVSSRPSRFKLRPRPGETRDPERIDRILAKLGELWKQQPDTRLGQLVYNLSAMASPNGDVFMTEDDVIEEFIDGKLGQDLPKPPGA